MNTTEYKLFTEQLLKQAGKIALKYFRKSNADIKSKEDGSLVTIADKEIEQFLRKEINKKYKGHSILGEEFGFTKSSSKILSKFTWVIDPIDGTASFSAGRPMWGIMIGLIVDNVPVLGAVYAPFTDELWIGVREKAKGKKEEYVSYFNNKKIKPLTPYPLSLTPKILATTGPQYFNPAGKKFFEALAKKADSVVYGGDCYNFCLLANGHIHTIYEQNLKVHDYVPLLPILLGSGAKVTDEKGKEIQDLTKPQTLLVTKW